MSKPIAYILNDWEINGYDDSDFQYALWVPSAKKVVCYEYGSTRYAGKSHDYNIKPLTVAGLKESRKYLESRILERLRGREAERRKGEVIFARGQEARLVKPVIFKDKRNRDADGNPTVVKAGAGETGTIIWTGHFGTFYRNGYNHPSRENQRVGIKFEGGRVVFCAATKAVLVVGQGPSDEDLKASAYTLSFRYEFKSLVSSHGGWLTANPALAKAKELGLDCPE